MMNSSAYPIVLGGGLSPLLNDYDLVRHIREKCGAEVAEVVSSYIVGMDSDDLDDIDSLINDLTRTIKELEETVGNMRASAKAARSRLKM